MDSWRWILATLTRGGSSAVCPCSLFLSAPWAWAHKWDELGSSSSLPTARAAWGSALSFSPDSLANELSSCESILRFSNNRKRRAACPGVRPHAGRGVAASNFEEHQSHDLPRSQCAFPSASALLPPALEPFVSLNTWVTQGIATRSGPAETDILGDRAAADEKWQVGMGMLSPGKCAFLMCLPWFGLPKILKSSVK